jgi:hypothetical protein
LHCEGGACRFLARGAVACEDEERGFQQLEGYGPAGTAACYGGERLGWHRVVGLLCVVCLGRGAEGGGNLRWTGGAGHVGMHAISWSAILGLRTKIILRRTWRHMKEKCQRIRFSKSLLDICYFEKAGRTAPGCADRELVRDLTPKYLRSEQHCSLDIERNHSRWLKVDQ